MIIKLHFRYDFQGIPLSILPSFTYDNFVPNYYFINYVLTDENGIATFKNLKVTEGSDGKFLVVFYVVSGIDLKGEDISRRRFLNKLN